MSRPIRYTTAARILALVSIVLVAPTTDAFAADKVIDKLCGKHICGSMQENSIVIDGVIRRSGQLVRSRSAPGKAIGAQVAAAVFEFRRSQVCGGLGFVPEGGTSLQY